MFYVETTSEVLDSDTDGLSDFIEDTVHGTDWNNSDTDADGLSDWIEVMGVTNALLWDTDGDGLYDEFENYKELDPEDIDTDDDTLVDEEEEGMWDDQEDYYDKDDDKKKKDKKDDGGGCMVSQTPVSPAYVILILFVFALFSMAIRRKTGETGSNSKQ